MKPVVTNKQAKKLMITRWVAMGVLVALAVAFVSIYVVGVRLGIFGLGEGVFFDTFMIWMTRAAAVLVACLVILVGVLSRMMETQGENDMESKGDDSGFARPTTMNKKETREYWRRLGEAIGSSADLYEIREKRRGNKNTVIYLPTFMKWDTRKMEGVHYPDTWYYKLQQALIEYFATRKEFTFVWKGLPSADEIYNPIPDFIADEGFSNIEVATNPFTEHLLSADRVIHDYPSTGFYESVVAGVPTMSLCYKAMRYRQSAVDYFGSLLKFFTDIPEAIKHIDEFLNSDPELYKATIETEDRSILEILEESMLEEVKG